MLGLQEFLDFCDRDENLDNREMVEAIVYYLTVIAENDHCTASEVRQSFASLNHTIPSRVAQYLSEGTSLKRQQYVKKNKGYALHRRNLTRLSTELGDVIEKSKPKIQQGILNVDNCTGGRNYLISMVEQINGSYEYGFYDGCAVLMRRMMETLIIATFQANSLENLIMDESGNFLMLNALINQAKNKTNVKLSRGMAEIMDTIKDLGDTAAHNRTYITKKEDIDINQLKYRRLIEELCLLSGVIKH